VFNLKLRALRQDLRQFLESVGQEIRFATIVARERMGSLYGPIDIVRNVGKELTTVTSHEVREDVSNLRKRY